MNVPKKAASAALVLSLLASLCASIAAPLALASTVVVSAGSVPVGGTSASAAAFTFTENTANSFPASGGTLVVTITDSASAPRVHFTGSPTLLAPGSLGAGLAIGAGGSSFTVTAVASDTANIEKVTVSGLLISADAGAALGPIIATLGGTLAGDVIGGTVTATGTIQGGLTTSASAVVVNVSSPCGFAITGGSNSTVNFSDTSDARQITTATALASGQQTLTIGAGAFAHPFGTTITQTVAYCLGTGLGSPGAVGGVGLANQLVFITPPGGGAAGAIWSQQPVVALENTLGQVVTTDNTTFVSLTIGTNPAGGSLSCTSGTGRTVVNGIATFFGCSITPGSASAYTLVAQSNPVSTSATSPAFFISGTLGSVALVDAIASGVNRGTSGFGVASLVVGPNSYVTVLGTTSPSLSGATVQIWTRTRTGVWQLLTSRIVAADGTIHVFARVNGWTAYQLRFTGNAAYLPAASHGRIATNPS